MLEHLFLECWLARIATGWIYFNLLQVHPAAHTFTVDERAALRFQCGYVYFVNTLCLCAL
jgi:hypothetical protein